MTLCGTPYELRRVLAEDDRREASFSFLLSTNINMGVVLPKPYSDFVEDSHE